MQLEWLEEKFSIGKYPPNQPLVLQERYCFAARTDRECSLLCPTAQLPPNPLAQVDDWCGLRVVGQLDFSLVGILAALTATLAQASIAVFAVSTYDTDYLFLRAADRACAQQVLQANGYLFV